MTGLDARGIIPIDDALEGFEDLLRRLSAWFALYSFFEHFEDIFRLDFFTLVVFIDSQKLVFVFTPAG